MYTSARMARLAIIIVPMLLVSGCATVSNKPPLTTPSSPGKPPGGEDATAPKMLNITPLTTLTDRDAMAGAKGGIFTNAYTRVLVLSTVADELRGRAVGEVAILPYEPRNALAGYLVGEKYDMNLSVKMKIGAFEATSPLVTLSH